MDKKEFDYYPPPLPTSPHHLLLLSSSLVGANHTSARFCSR
jgi:hypothetical protein